MSLKQPMAKCSYLQPIILKEEEDDDLRSFSPGWGRWGQQRKGFSGSSRQQKTLEKETTVDRMATASEVSVDCQAQGADLISSLRALKGEIEDKGWKGTASR